MAYSFPEEGREMLSDHFLDVGTENAREFQQGQPCQTATAAQAYGQGEVGIEARIRLRVPEIKPRYWRVIFERAGINPEIGRFSAFGDLPRGLINVESVHRHQEQSMLVDVDETVKRRENDVIKSMTYFIVVYGCTAIKAAMTRWFATPSILGGGLGLPFLSRGLSMMGNCVFSQVDGPSSSAS